MQFFERLRALPPRFCLLAGLMAAVGCGANESPDHLASQPDASRAEIRASAPSQQWVVSVRDDNDDAALPAHWRGWWTARLDDVQPGVPADIRVERLAWPQQTLPMFSYDRQHWSRFEESEVHRPSPDVMHMRRTFEHTTVYVAPYQPYDLADLDGFVDAIGGHPHVRIETLGLSAAGHALVMVHVTDDSVDDAAKKRIWVHARTHPGEVGSSMVAEGLLRFLLSDAAAAHAARRQFVASVVLVTNPDGVACGNYRTTPRSENLEVLWRHPEGTDATPPSPWEIATLQRKFLQMQDAGPPFVAALNLHATHSEPDDAPYFVIHFGPRRAGYASAEADLWHRQQALATAMARRARDAGLRVADDLIDGGRRFLQLSFPETWFWKQRGPEILAVTFETVYGRARADGGWLGVDDQKALGVSLGQALVDTLTQ